MATLEQLQPHIVYRLALAKSIFKKALELCQIQNDTFSFSHGLIALHDALDNFTGAIASYLNVSLPQESKLLQTINLIQEHEKKNDASFILVSRNEIVQLNTIRNNIKHQGIVPNVDHAKGLIPPIISFFQEYSRRYFALEWELVSIADLITDDSIKEQMKVVENLIGEGKYKDALNELGIIKFKVFEEMSMRIRLNPRYDLGAHSEEDKKLRESNNIFPKRNRDGFSGIFFDLYHRADFLEKGIDCDLMAKFETLTAKVGINNNKEWKYILKHDHNWSAPNWTKENAIFCYDFLIDAILKNQRRVYNFKENFVLTSYTVQAREDIRIYNKDDELIYTMPKGEKRNALIFGRIDGKWEIYDKSDCLIELTKEGDKDEFTGYFPEADKEKFDFLNTAQYLSGQKGWIPVYEGEGG